MNALRISAWAFSLRARSPTCFSNARSARSPGCIRSKLNAPFNLPKRLDKRPFARSSLPRARVTRGEYWVGRGRG